MKIDWDEKLECRPRLSDNVFHRLRNKARKYGHNTPSAITKSILRQLKRLDKQDRLVIWNDNYVAGIKNKS